LHCSHFTIIVLHASLSIGVCMAYIVYNTKDHVSMGIASALFGVMHFERAPDMMNYKHFFCSSTNAHMLELNTSLLEAEPLDGLNTDLIIFLSKHSSSKGIPAFTVHATGNWSGEATLGGKPKELSTAAPLYMHAVLKALKELNDNESMSVTYEATHHGPLLKTPSMFTEIEEHSYNEHNAVIAASAVAKGLLNAEKLRVAIGIGGMHYPQKFTSLALSGRYAFSHMMPKYYIDDTDMLSEAVERSLPKADIAVIDWKSTNAAQRDKIINELSKIGIIYERA